MDKATNKHAHEWVGYRAAYRRGLESAGDR
jgi:hypothetical protein